MASPYKLKNPAFVLRYKRFSFLVDALKRNGHITADLEISKKTNNYNPGNISSFLAGTKPISANFFDQFLAAYTGELAPIIQSEAYQAIKVDDVSMTESPTGEDMEDILEEIEQRLSSQEHNIHILAEQHKKDMEHIIDRLADLTAAVNLLSMQPPKKKKVAKKAAKPRPPKKDKK